MTTPAPISQQNLRIAELIAYNAGGRILTLVEYISAALDAKDDAAAGLVRALKLIRDAGQTATEVIAEQALSAFEKTQQPEKEV